MATWSFEEAGTKDELRSALMTEKALACPTAVIDYIDEILEGFESNRVRVKAHGVEQDTNVSVFLTISPIE